jgi:energy-coupling factor transporter ATP-binding protein EcfA2
MPRPRPRFPLSGTSYRKFELNRKSGGIVLDDPVTSQDHQRKTLIAKRLVAEAANRQVVVFTHSRPSIFKPAHQCCRNGGLLAPGALD